MRIHRTCTGSEEPRENPAIEPLQRRDALRKILESLFENKKTNHLAPGRIVPRKMLRDYLLFRTLSKATPEQ